MRVYALMVVAGIALAACESGAPSSLQLETSNAAIAAAESVEQVLDEIVGLVPEAERSEARAGLKSALDQGAAMTAPGDPKRQKLIERLFAAQEREAARRTNGQHASGRTFTIALGSTEQVGANTALLSRDPARIPPDVIVLNERQADAADIDHAVKLMRRFWGQRGYNPLLPALAAVDYEKHRGGASRSARSTWSRLQGAPLRNIDGIGTVRAVSVRIR